MQRAQVWSLGWEDPPKEEMATHSSILAWEIPWTEETGKLQPMGRKSQKWLSNWAWSRVQDLIRTKHEGKVECKITLIILGGEAWDDSLKMSSVPLSGNTQQKVGNVGENLWEYKMGSYQYKVKKLSCENEWFLWETNQIEKWKTKDWALKWMSSIQVADCKEQVAKYINLSRKRLIEKGQRTFLWCRHQIDFGFNAFFVCLFCFVCSCSCCLCSGLDAQ